MALYYYYRNSCECRYQNNIPMTHILQFMLFAEDDIMLKQKLSTIMLGLFSIKDRIATIGEGIKSQFVTETEPEETNTSPNAGNKILTYYQVNET